jgi:DNA mismatch endonuclease, patch repair protein
MQALSRKRDTGPELSLRRELHRRGLRYRVDVAPLSQAPRRRADVVFRSAKVAVFVDGCFWHGCPDHGVRPATNAAWWAAKLARTADRDRETAALLARDGWRVVRVWEHEDAGAAAAAIDALVRSRGGR